MIDLLIYAGIAAYKVAAAKAVVAGTVKVGGALGAHALANGGASAALLPHVAAGGTTAHAIGAGTLGVTGSVAHGAGAGGVSSAFGALVVNEFAARDRAILEGLLGKPVADPLWRWATAP
jgi:hypothetical protein